MNTNVCCACLSNERKMFLIDDIWKKQCFLQIIKEMPMSPVEVDTVWLCWECEALLRRFLKFTLQVRHSYQLMHDHLKKYKNLSPIHKPSKLSTHKIFNIATIPKTTEHNNAGNLKSEDENIFEVIKQGSKCADKIFDVEVKVERDDTDNQSNYSSHNDNEEDCKVLIEFSSKKKNSFVKNKGNKTIKKKKKKGKSNYGMKTYKEVQLTAKEIEDERGLLALKEEYVDALFKCDKCIITFPNAEDLKDHNVNKHELTAKHVCKVCECKFISEVSYNYHVSRHIRRYQCTLCEGRFVNRRRVKSHYEAIHYHTMSLEDKLPKGKSDCQQIREPSTNYSAKSDLMFPCEYCQKTFRWKTSLRKHNETHRIEAGQKRKPYCETCKLSFSTTSNLQKHVKASSKHQIQLKLRKLKDTVLKDSNSPDKEQVHLEQIKWSVNNSRKQHVCVQCNRSFQWRGNLLRHLNSHTASAKGELVCKPCNRTFSSIATFQQHMTISKKHVTENDYKYMCSECGKRFANKTRMTEHVNWDHLQNYVHKCSAPSCGKVFKSHTSLYLHKQVVHNKKNPEHLCNHCGKPFPNHTKLRNHITALHSGEAPFHCKQCSARFSWHSCLSRHVRKIHPKQDNTQ